MKLYLLILFIILAGCKTSQQLAIELDKSINAIVKGVINPSSIQKKSTATVQPRRETEPYSKPNNKSEPKDVRTEPYSKPNNKPEPKDVGTEPYSKPNNKPEPKGAKNKTAVTKSEICIKVQQGDRDAILTALNERISCAKPKNKTAATQPEQKDAVSKTLEYSDEEICIGVKMKKRDFIKLALTKKLRC